MARDNKILNPENQNSKLQRDRGLPCGIPSLPLLGCPVSSLLLFSPTTSTSHRLPDSGPASIFLLHPSQQPHCHPPALCFLHVFCPLSLLSHLESGPRTAAPYPGRLPKHRSCLHLAMSSHQCDGSWGSPSHPELSQVSPPALVSPSISPTQPEAPGGQ